MAKTTVDIHGKDYELVASRVTRFRNDHKLELGIETKLLSSNEHYVVVQAVIKNPDGFIIGSGIAEEQRGSTNINKTSALENCETSAIGRALASIGYLGTEYASADEVANAISQQNPAAQIKQEQQLDNVAEDIFKDLCFLGTTLKLSKDDSKQVWDNLKGVGITRGRWDSNTKTWSGTKLTRKQAPLVIRAFADKAGYTDESKETLVMQILGDTPNLEDFSDDVF